MFLPTNSHIFCWMLGNLTWSGFSPGGTHVYSSNAHPESSSECWLGIWRGISTVPEPAWFPSAEFVVPPLPNVDPVPLRLLGFALSIELFRAFPLALEVPDVVGEDPPGVSEPGGWTKLGWAPADITRGSMKPADEEEAWWSSFGHLQFRQTFL